MPPSGTREPISENPEQRDDTDQRRTQQCGAFHAQSGPRVPMPSGFPPASSPPLPAQLRGRNDASGHFKGYWLRRGSPPPLPSTVQTHRSRGTGANERGRNIGSIHSSPTD